MPRITFTSADEVRAVFNADVVPRYLDGELSELTQDSSAAHPVSGQPRGTRSERVVYYDGGKPVAVAHRFVAPDGSIGGSGLPDPKAVRLGDEWLVVGSDQQRRP